METIKTYIDNVFKAFPPSDERVVTLKRDMLAGMEEKYNELKSEGKSENEAIGGVIADFGNADEIAAELGFEAQPLKSETKSEQATRNQLKSITLSSQEVIDFIAKTKRSAVWFGVGTWLILAGVAAMIMLGSVSQVLGAVGIFVLLMSVGGAVAIFISQGIAMQPYEAYERKHIILDEHTRRELEREHERFTPAFAALIAGGVVVILVGVGVLIMLRSLVEGYGAVSVAQLLFLIGLSAFMFINGGMRRESTEMLLEVGDYAKKKRLEASIHEHIEGKLENAFGSNLENASNGFERLIATVAAVFWPLVTAGYLLWSFISDSWGISWIVWPVAGILFGAFAGGVSVWNSMKNDSH